MIMIGVESSSAYLAGIIGGLYYDEKINYLDHKLLHGILGAGTGFVVAKLFNKNVN